MSFLWTQTDVYLETIQINVEDNAENDIWAGHWTNMTSFAHFRIETFQKDDTLQKTSLDAMVCIVYDLKVPIVISVFSDCQKQLNKE